MAVGRGGFFAHAAIGGGGFAAPHWWLLRSARGLGGVASSGVRCGNVVRRGFHTAEFPGRALRSAPLALGWLRLDAPYGYDSDYYDYPYYASAGPMTAMALLHRAHASSRPTAGASGRSKVLHYYLRPPSGGSSPPARSIIVEGP